MTHTAIRHPLPAGIEILDRNEIDDEDTETAYRGPCHTAFISERSTLIRRPVCTLYSTEPSNDGGHVDYRYLDRLEMHEVEELILLLQTVLDTMRAITDRSRREHLRPRSDG